MFDAANPGVWGFDMRVFIKVGVAVAVLVTSMVGAPVFEGTPLGASEAVAGDRYYRGRRHHRDRFDLGDAVVGAIVAGGLIAVLSGASKKQRDVETDRPLESGWEPRGDWDQRSNDWAWADRDWPNRTNEERAAVAACAREAEDLGGRYEREARVREIGDVDRKGGEYRVQGQLDVRSARGGDDDARSTDSFVCYVRNDRITDFRFGEGYAGH